MFEIKCKGCGLVLGGFRGKGRIKCHKCGGINRFNTNTGDHNYRPDMQHTELKDRATSSGMVFR
nr:MAG TPA: hypothetical protein [Caudoviricetes sp.]